MQKNAIAFALCGAAALLSACISHNYEPGSTPENRRTITAFTGGPAVASIAAEASSETFLLMKMGPHRFWGNLETLGKQAVFLFDSAFSSAGGVVDAAASKSITLRLSDIKGQHRFLHDNCAVELEVTTGDGVTEIFPVAISSGVSLDNACTGAIDVAVAEALNHESIRNYIEGR
jgi:hypothetical protein